VQLLFPKFKKTIQIAPLPVYPAFINIIIALLKSPNYGLRNELLGFINTNMATSSCSQHRILYLKLLETAAGQISKNTFVGFFSEGISSFTKEPLLNVASKLS